MNKRRQDSELLREFVRRGDQSAFAAVVRQHLDLVYATALRKVEDQGAAEEVAQNVFAALARKAWQFAPDDSLPAWLYRTTLLEAKAWLRGELRRRRREQTAAELGTTMRIPDEQPALRSLVPLLDDALLSLREGDRAALLLRYYETQSLREVGAALGVGEDAAQKRVAGALERLAQFFQRRGFKTATVAATAAALQHTAISTPAAVATAVLQSAMQAAPPALAGLTVLLARLASLTKAQTAALCLAVATMPAAWQWNEMRAVEKEAAAMQANLDGAPTQQEQLSADLERLRAESVRLETALTNAEQAQARNEETTRRLEALKTRFRGLLRDADYRWSEDLPFVRIPKSALASITMGIPLTPPGLVLPAARELLGLTAEERQACEETLRRYFADLDQRFEAMTYETNRAVTADAIPDGAVTSRVFVLPALGEEAGQSAERLMAELLGILGSERWAIIKPLLESSGGSHSLRRILNLDASKESQEVIVGINQSAGESPTVSFRYVCPSQGSYGWSGTPLSEFLPVPETENAPQRGAALKTSLLPSALVNRIARWLGQEAEARLSNVSKP